MHFKPFNLNMLNLYAVGIKNILLFVLAYQFNCYLSCSGESRRHWKSKKNYGVRRQTESGKYKIHTAAISEVDVLVGWTEKSSTEVPMFFNCLNMASELGISPPWSTSLSADLSRVPQHHLESPFPGAKWWLDVSLTIFKTGSRWAQIAGSSCRFEGEVEQKVTGNCSAAVYSRLHIDVTLHHGLTEFPENISRHSSLRPTCKLLCLFICL